MKATEVLDFKVEEVNGNDVWTWSIYGNIKPGELIVCTDGENDRYFYIFSEEIDLATKELMVEELTKNEFDNHVTKYNHEVFEAECFNLMNN